MLSQDKEHFAEIAVNAVLKLKGSTNLDQIQIIKRIGGTLIDSYLDPDGFLLDKKIGVGCPKRMADCKVVVANTPMDTDKVKIYGAKVKVDSVAKVSEIEVRCVTATRNHLVQPPPRPRVTTSRNHLS